MPEQVLDLNIPMLQAFVEGYQERLFDEQCLAVHQGYWAGYYQSKKPKAAETVISRMVTNHEKAKKNKKNTDLNVPKPEVDMERFLQLEQKRAEYLEHQKGK